MATSTKPRTRGRGEPKRVVAARLDPHWLPQIDAAAAARGGCRGDVIREAVARLLAAEEDTTRW